MKNVTVVLDEELARWTRIKAARENMSVSRLIGRMLRREKEDEERYSASLSYYMSRQPTRLKKRGKYPSRESLYDRVRVR